MPPPLLSGGQLSQLPEPSGDEISCFQSVAISRLRELDKSQIRFDHRGWRRHRILCYQQGRQILLCERD